MKTTSHPTAAGLRARRGIAFTLIELLVVIAVIALLASLIFPVTKAVNRQKIRTKARAELAQIQTAIESYKAKLGHYPPDNPGSPSTNQLYFELIGTTYNGQTRVYTTQDGGASIADNPGAWIAAFGATNGQPRVQGFVNCTRGGGEEAASANNYFHDIKPAQVWEYLPGVRMIVCSIPWRGANGMPTPNPVNYNSSNPTNNPNSYDLWMDVLVDGQTNRISNWSRQPLIVNTPRY